MEKWDIYDIDRKKTGRLATRGEKLAEGEYHLSVHICIFDRLGRLLIQRRADCKRDWAGLWDISAAGAVTVGESSAMGAERELSEELGLYRDFTKIRPHLTLNYRDGFGDIYLLTEDEIPLDTLTLQESEVSAVRYATESEVLAMIDGGEFIPYFKSFISTLFDIRHRYSSMTRGAEGNERA
jgi:isopentenyldiphosphate isomerase